MIKRKQTYRKMIENNLHAKGYPRACRDDYRKSASIRESLHAKGYPRAHRDNCRRSPSGATSRTKKGIDETEVSKGVRALRSSEADPQGRGSSDGGSACPSLSGTKPR